MRNTGGFYEQHEVLRHIIIGMSWVVKMRGYYRIQRLPIQGELHLVYLKIGFLMFQEAGYDFVDELALDLVLGGNVVCPHAQQIRRDGWIVHIYVKIEQMQLLQSGVELYRQYPTSNITLLLMVPRLFLRMMNMAWEDALICSMMVLAMENEPSRSFLPPMMQS